MHLSPCVQAGQTPFLTAAARGHVEVASFLLDNGSSILERTLVSDHINYLAVIGCKLSLTMECAIGAYN